MRHIVAIFAAALLFTACKQDDDLETKKDVIVTDTSSMYNSNAFTDTGATREVVVAPPAPQKVRTVTRTVYVDRKTPARRRTYREANPSAPIDNSPSTQNTGTNTQGTGTGTTAGTTPGTTTPAPAEKDKGWSNSTKGAVIGGVGGAIGGAILSKKKGKGAIIGGVVGAAGGYIIGRKKDRRDTAR